MKALITCLISGEYTLYDLEKKQYLSSIARGVFRNNKISPKVGDLVEYQIENNQPVINEIYPRHNDFIRPQIANIDQAFIVTSVKEPNINLNLLDRMIANFEYQEITPILVFSKIDLLEEKNEIDTIIHYYQNIGYKTISTSTLNPFSIDDLKKDLNEKVSIITGQSGVGKSSILNLIDDTINLETNSISKALNRGKHTTRFTRLYNIENGWIADSPGFGIVSFDTMNEVDLSHCFTEFFKLSKSCKYNGCLHLNEPGCKVKNELKNKNILESRYENYLQFNKEIKNKRKW